MCLNKNGDPLSERCFGQKTQRFFCGNQIVLMVATSLANLRRGDDDGHGDDDDGHGDDDDDDGDDDDR